MKIGTQYYRDPNPPEKFWRNDLANIAEKGFSFIGCWIPWRYVNPERGRWNPDKYRRLFDIAREYELGVRVQLVPESAPDWVVRDFPETLIVSSAGQAVYLHAHSMLQLGGWPGLNSHHPTARALIDDYYRQVVGRLKDHLSILTWNVWNEIQHPWDSYDRYTETAYQAWIKEKYGTIDAYNRKKGAQFLDFTEVIMPNPAIQADLILLSDAADFAEFKWNATIEEAKRRAGLVREIDPSRPVSMHTNTNSPYPGDRDDWFAALHADIYGNSTYNQDAFADTMSCIKQRSIKGPGKWWLTEHSGGRMAYYYGHYTYTAQNMVSDVLRAAGHGAANVSFWQYRNEIVGQEAPNFGLLNQDGTLSERVEAVSRLSRILSTWNAETLTYDPAEIGLLFEPLDMVFRSASECWWKQPWQECNEFEQWLRAILDLGYSPDFLRTESICSTAPGQSLKVIIAPSLVVLRDGLVEKLAPWIQSGGHLIAGPFTGVFNPRGETFEKFPGDGLAELFGLHVTERVSGERFDFNKPGGKTKRLSGKFLFEYVHTQKATEVLLEWKGKPAALKRSFGKGTLTYLTSFVGADYAVGSRLLTAWLDKHLRTCGIQPPMDIKGPVWVNTAHYQKQRVVFLQNPSEKRCTAKLRLPSEIIIRDPFEERKIRTANKIAVVPLAGRQVRVLMLSPKNTEK
ncbi:MAG: beta-galactosidase [Candidatus Omnitrophota bacterium]